ncbi:MAG: GC-type dockerin domain-anchored protein [Phycisphaerales bacterium]
MSAVASRTTARRRSSSCAAPFHTINASGVSVYDGIAGNTIVSGPSTYPSSIRYAWRKDVNPDVNFDGLVDFGGLGTLVVGGGPNPVEIGVNSERAATPPVGNAWQMEPYQMVDDIAWSNGGGKEYSRSKQQEISDTTGFNPDAVSRLAYYGANPQRGSLFSGGEMKQTHMADEEFVYGDILDSAPLVSYAPGFVGGPTDQSGPLYNDSGVLDPAGTHRLNDINLTGFKLTPGSFNDVDATASGGRNNVQFRFVRGDFNFDGVVNCDDRNMIYDMWAAGALLDDTQAKVAERGTDDAADDVAYTGWKWQGREFNGLMAMVRMSTADGTTGEWNSGTTITRQDVTAFDALFTAHCCPADIGLQGGLPGRDGALDNNDFIVFISHFFNHNNIADMGVQGGLPGHDGQFDNNDFIAFIGLFFQGCN